MVVFGWLLFGWLAVGTVVLLVIGAKTGGGDVKDLGRMVKEGAQGLADIPGLVIPLNWIGSLTIVSLFVLGVTAAWPLTAKALGGRP